MGLDVQDSVGVDRQQAGRQNSSANRRQQNYRNKRNDQSRGTTYSQLGQGAQVNGHRASENQLENGNPSDDAASIDRHVLKLSTEVATIQEEIAHYRRILDERSELRQLQSDLQSTKEAAEATRQYHLTSVSHLEEKLKASESECDGMRNRLRAIHESAEQKETTLKKYEACMARQDALDREKGTQIEELSRKLGQAHLTSEQYRNQAESTSKQLDQAEQAKFDIETELAKLKLEVLAQSDSRKTEEAARAAGFQQAQKDYENMLKENQHSISLLEADLREALADKQRMEGHYKKECEHLCNVINAERRTPVVPLMSEKEMIQLITSVLPAGEEHAIQLGSGAFEAVQKAIWPNTWQQHYSPVYGSMLDFLLACPQHFAQRSDQAFYRPQASIRFGSAPNVEHLKPQDMSSQGQGKRLMTPEERTVGPPQATSSLLGRLQRGQDQQQPGVSQRLPQQASAEPAQPFFQQQVQPEGLQGAHDAQPAQAPRATGQAHPVVVTPFNPQVSGKQKVAAGQQADAGTGRRDSADERKGPRSGGWSSAAAGQRPRQTEILTVPTSAVMRSQEAGTVDPQGQAHQSRLRQAGSAKAETRSQAQKDILPPGMTQGQQQTPAAAGRAGSSAAARPPSQSSPKQKQSNGTDRKQSQGSALQENKQEGQKSGQGGSKGERRKQGRQAPLKDAGNPAGERALNLPPGFESVGKSSPLGTADRQHQNGGGEGSRRRADSYMRQSKQGAQDSAQAAAVSTKPAARRMNSKAVPEAEPQLHATWDTEVGDKPQRQGKGRRKGGHEAIQ